MMVDDFITEPLTLSWDNCNDHEALKSLTRDLKRHYGISYDEYKCLRNDLLIAHNYQLSYDVLEQALLKRAIISVVSKGYVSVDINADGVNYNVSVKGHKVLARAIIDGQLPDSIKSTIPAIIYLHNNNLIE